MITEDLRVKSLEAEQGGEALHFYQLWFQFSFRIFADTKIKGDHMRVTILVRYIFPRRNAPIGQFIESGIKYKVNNTFAGIQDFCRKYFINEYRRFRHPEIDSARIMTIEILQKFFVSFFGKCLIICRTD